MIHKKTEDVKEVWRSIFSQSLAAFLVNIALVGNGLVLGFPTILVAALAQDEGYNNSSIHLGEEELSWIGSIMFISVPIGSFFSGILSELFGKIRMLQFANIPFLMAWIIFFYSTKIWQVYLVLVMIGLVGGLFETPVVTFIAEMSEPHLRGILTSSSIFFFVIGIMTQFIFATFMNWKMAALCSGILPTVSFLVLFWIPESPLWLISKKRFVDAKRSLAWFRGWAKQKEVAEEYDELLRNFNRTSSENSGNVAENLRERYKLDLFCRRSFIVPFILLSYMFFLTQFTGLFPVQTYAVPIFSSLRSPISEYYATALFGLSGVIGCFITLFLLPIFGKRKMMFLSLGVIALCFVILGFYAFNLGILSLDVVSETRNRKDEENEEFSWIPVAAMLLGNTLARMGVLTIPWVLNGEIFPKEIRAVSAGISATAYYFFVFISNKCFLSLVSLMTLPGLFWFFSLVNLTGLLILFFTLPETEGDKLEDINKYFSNGFDMKCRKKETDVIDRE